MTTINKLILNLYLSPQYRRPLIQCAIEELDREEIRKLFAVNKNAMQL